MIVEGYVSIRLTDGTQFVLHQDEITSRDSGDPQKFAADLWNEIQGSLTTLLVKGADAHPAYVKFTPSAVAAVMVTKVEHSA